MSDWPVREITKDEAESALRAVAFTDEDGRTTVHSFLGTFGADHDLDVALEKVRTAAQVAWTTHWLRHDLAVLSDGKVFYYDVQRAERTGGGGQA